MNSFTENACANFLASLNMSDAGIIPFDFTAFDEIITESMYDSIFEYDNPARKGNNRKAKQNGKRNSTKANRLHGKDRKHGKHRELSRKEQDLVHYDATKGVHGAGVWYTSRGKKVVPIVSKGEKTNRNYYAKKYSQSADFKEKEYLEEMYTGLGDPIHENEDLGVQN